MKKKKMLGTIIGVILFAALIAGATYAWLSSQLNVTNGEYKAQSQDFVINYTKGTDVTSVPIVTTPTDATTTSLVVSAYRASTSATGTLDIILATSSSNTLVTSGAIKYAVCSGTATKSNCTGNLTSGSTGILATGSITTSGDKTLYTVTSIPTTKTYYWINFWLDGSVIDNTHIGQTYSGYIKAKATQN